MMRNLLKQPDTLFRAFCARAGRVLHIPEQLLRFLIIGGVNTVFAYCVYALCIFVGLHYTLAALTSTVLGTCFSFKTLGTLVFDNPDNWLIFKFIGVYTGCYFLNIGLLRLLFQFVCKNLYIDGLISAFLVALVSFSLNKWVVFKKKPAVAPK